ncbi:MAG: TonB-dependent receptor domain-containing protein [Flavobacterium sp.]
MKNLIAFFLLVLSAGAFAQDNTTVKDTVKSTEKELDQQLDEVVVEKKTKAVERKADRVIFDFAGQSHLNSGSLYEGLKKLPGLIISEVAGMMYQGKGLEVYMDGRPLNIYSNELNAYLEGLPANAVEKVEIITNPGAEFPATSGGAIINIISSKNAKKYLTATYSNGYSYTKYDISRHRFNNSLMLSAANSLFSWQVNGGHSYGDGFQETRFADDATVLTHNVSDRVNRFYYLRTGIKVDLKRDRLLVNYDMNSGNNNSYVKASGFGFVADDKSDTERYYHDVMATYQKRFDNPLTKLDFRFNYNAGKTDFMLDSRITGVTTLSNVSEQDFYQFRTDYTQEVSLFDKTKISAGLLADRLDFEAASFGLTNLDYTRNTYALYGEAQATVKKFDLIAGGRLESYDITGNTDTAALIPFKQTRFFPNAAVQYNIMPQIYVRANYSQKISLPNTSSLNPNNTSYQNPNVGFFGNPNLEPTIFNNYELSLSAFEYFTLGYYVSDASNLIENRIIDTGSGAASTSVNISRATTHSFNFGIPIPFILFTKGLAETLKMEFNPDEINFLYAYAGSHKNIIPGVDSKTVWNFNIMSQFLLPKKVKFTANFSTSTAGGNYNYYNVNRPMSQELDLTFSRKFLSDNLSVSLYANDVLNTNRNEFGAVGTNLVYASRYDSRRIGISFSYKIPTKNKAAQESNILNNNGSGQQEEPGIK